MIASQTPASPVPARGLVILLALLGMVGPFSMDTYIPAFAGVAQALGGTPVQMQQTLSAYMFGFAFMNLFHGALSDSLGRRPVVMWSLAVFAVASVGCALAKSLEQLVFFRAVQGLASGAGIVVSRAVIRDLFPPDQAQKAMSQVTVWFGVGPAVAPVIGGWLYVQAGWESIFWFLAGLGGVLWLLNLRMLPESLQPAQRQPFNLRNLMQGYQSLVSDPRFVLLALATAMPFNGLLLYVVAGPAFLGTHLQLAPTQFFWLFFITILGFIGGAVASGRLAGRILPRRQIQWGFGVMLAASAVNVSANALWTAHVAWALLPIAVFAFGWALMTPVVTLLLQDLHPTRRGLASSLQVVVASAANGVVAGAVAPLVMQSTLGLAVTSLLIMAVGLVAWMGLCMRWPQVGGQLAPAA